MGRSLEHGFLYTREQRVPTFVMDNEEVGNDVP